MKQPFELKNKPNTRLANNLKIALEAIKYARQIVPINNSSTQPLVQDKKRIKELTEKIQTMRKEKLALEDCLAYFLSRTTQLEESKQAYFLLAINLVMKKLEAVKAGNCFELSAAAIKYLLEFRVNAEMACIVNSDHVIVIIDRDPKSDIKDVKNFGASCVILDVLNNEAYPASRIYSRLSCYRLDMKEADPHVLTPFTPQHQLGVKGTITCDSDNSYKKGLQVEFYSKLKVIEESITTYLKICKFEEGNDLNKLKKVIQISKKNVANYNLYESTNLKIENKLSKEMQSISREIFTCTSVKIDTILSNIITDIGKLYSSETRYLGHLHYFANHNKLFAAILARNLSQHKMSKPVSTPKADVTPENDVIVDDEELFEKNKKQTILADEDSDYIIEENFEAIMNKLIL